MAKISKELLRKEINCWKSPMKLFKKQYKSFGSYMDKKYNFFNNDLKTVSNREAIKIIIKTKLKN